MGLYFVGDATEALKASLGWNNFLFENALQVVVDVSVALWTVLSAFLSLCAAIVTLVLNSAAVVVTLIPQISSTVVFLCCSSARFFLHTLALLKAALAVAHSFAHDTALLCSDVLRQIEVFVHDTRFTLQSAPDALQTCLESTAESFTDLASLFDRLRYSVYLLLCAAVDRLLSIVLFILWLPFRLLLAIPLPVYGAVVGLPLGYRLIRVTWAWMRTQNHITSTPLFRAVETSKTFVECRCWDPGKRLILVVSRFIYSKVLNPVKLWTIFASQAMVDQVYIPFLQDLTRLARHSIRLYVEFLLLVGGFCFTSASRLFFLLWDSVLFLLSFVFRFDILLSCWRLMQRYYFSLCDLARRLTREGVVYVAYMKYLALIGLRALVLRLSHFRYRLGTDVGFVGAFFGRRNAGTATNRDANVVPVMPGDSCSTSTSSASAVSSSSGQEAVVQALRRELTEAEERQRCVVCLNALKSMLILPCRHACLCRPCAVEIINHADINQRLCPLCRTLMHEVLHVYI